jgi:uncharacterized membrane protein YedE/YeeE
MATAWINGLIGGLLIGTASALYLLVNGRIAGTSGMIGNLLRLEGDAAGLQSGAFLVGAFGAAALWSALVATPSISITHSALALVASGLMVGIGVTFSNGCTSGHGVSGMSRFSVRSIAATATFMAATALTVGLLRHGLGVTP